MLDKSIYLYDCNVSVKGSIPADEHVGLLEICIFPRREDENMSMFLHSQANTLSWVNISMIRQAKPVPTHSVPRELRFRIALPACYL